MASKHPHFPQGGGGLERNTHELCLRLAHLGVQPAVMCDLRADGSTVLLSNRLKRLANHRVRFPSDRRFGYPIYRGWAEEDGAQELLRRFKPDVVIAQSGEPAPLLTAFGPAVARMAYFHEIERLEHLDEISSIGGIGLLANSEFTARKMAERSNVPAEVIRPLIDPKFYRTTTDRHSVLFVNTVPRKGLEIAFALAAARPDVPFDFVTSWILLPADRAAMEVRARAAGNITLHPPTNDMRSHYARAKLLLAPSQWEETWGRVATEAQINGIPVLASDRGGLPEAVGPGGVLVAHDAPIDRWTAALTALWDDPQLYAEAAAQALAHSRRPEIEPDEIARRFVEVVSQFVAQTGSGARRRVPAPAP